MDFETEEELPPPETGVRVVYLGPVSPTGISKASLVNNPLLTSSDAVRLPGCSFCLPTILSSAAIENA